MGVLCINQVLDLLLLCAECVPCTVALLLYTGVENECRMAEGVSVLLTQHQRVAVERLQSTRCAILLRPPPSKTRYRVKLGPQAPNPVRLGVTRSI